MTIKFMMTLKKSKYKKVTCGLTKHDIAIIQELISISDNNYPTIGSWLRHLVQEKNLEYLKDDPERYTNYLYSYHNEIFTLGENDFEYIEEVLNKSLSASEDLENKLIEVSEYIVIGD